jgi:hypothetical protein
VEPAYAFCASHKILCSTTHDFTSVPGDVMQIVLTFLNPVLCMAFEGFSMGISSKSSVIYTRGGGYFLFFSVTLPALIYMQLYKESFRS